jgi:hypothetical protein
MMQSAISASMAGPAIEALDGNSTASKSQSKREFNDRMCVSMKSFEILHEGLSAPRGIPFELQVILCVEATLTCP